MWEAVTLETLTRLGASLATATGIGSLGAQAWIGRSDDLVMRRNTARLRALQLAAALLGVVAPLCRAVAHGLSVAGDEPLTAGTLWLVVGESRWGHAWRWPMGAAVLVLAAAWRHRARPRPLLPAAAFALVCIATPRLGHGAGGVWQAVGHALHVAATGAWLGTVVAIGATLRAGTAEEHDAWSRTVRRFSPWALGAALVTLISGTALAVVYLGRLEALVASPYGRLLLVKLAVVGAVAGCGAGNWWRIRTGRSIAPRLIRCEAALAVVALAATALLGETAHP